jgi:hypothetical protein
LQPLAAFLKIASRSTNFQAVSAWAAIAGYNWKLTSELVIRHGGRVALLDEKLQ